MHEDLSQSEQKVIKKLGKGLMVSRPIGREARAIRRLQSKGLVTWEGSYKLTARGREIPSWLKV